MTRKHFRAIAEAIRKIESLQQRDIEAKRLAAVCRASNPRFDDKRFFRACGL